VMRISSRSPSVSVPLFGGLPMRFSMLKLYGQILKKASEKD
jgi:hypothetical protein